MGYHTSLHGRIEIVPELTGDHLAAVKGVMENEHPRTSEVPGTYCPWSTDGTHVFWDHCEKPYDYTEWLEWLIERYFSPWGYTLGGEVEWLGEDSSDRGTIYVKDNRVEAVRDLISNPGPSWNNI